MQTANRVFALDGLFRCSTRLTAPQVLVDGEPGRRPERTRAQSARRNALLDISALRRLPGVPADAVLPHYLSRKPVDSCPFEGWLSAAGVDKELKAVRSKVFRNEQFRRPLLHRLTAE